jgi:hypothetical protein
MMVTFPLTMVAPRYNLKVVSLRHLCQIAPLVLTIKVRQDLHEPTLSKQKVVYWNQHHPTWTIRHLYDRCKSHLRGLRMWSSSFHHRGL